MFELLPFSHQRCSAACVFHFLQLLLSRNSLQEKRCCLRSLLMSMQTIAKSSVSIEEAASALPLYKASSVCAGSVLMTMLESDDGSSRQGWVKPFSAICLWLHCTGHTVLAQIHFGKVDSSKSRLDTVFLFWLHCKVHEALTPC